MLFLQGSVHREDGTPRERMDHRCPPAVTVDWLLLGWCLTGGTYYINDNPNGATLFAEATRKACDLGGIPCEIVAGTPAARYGARVTFRLPAAKAAFLAEFGLDRHPWGEPNWVGLRKVSGAGVAAKAYHAIRALGPLPFDRRLTEHLSPLMASFYQCEREDY